MPMCASGEAEAEAALSAGCADCLVGSETGVCCWEKGTAVARVTVVKRSNMLLGFIVIEWALVVAFSFVVEEDREMLDASAWFVKRSRGVNDQVW